MAKKEFIDDLAAMEQILRDEQVGWLAMNDGGVPYMVPLNHAYMDGKILFHCALTGKKLDAIRSQPRVCFGVGRQSGLFTDHGGGQVCHVDSHGVLCFGVARIVEDPAEKLRLLNAFNRRYRPTAADLDAKRLAGCEIVEIAIEHMTGRKEEDRHRTYWTHTFK